MTSSLKATGRASVRQTPGAALGGAAVWSLTDLTAAAAANPGSAAVAISAEERAALVEEGYTSGFADGQRQAIETAQARVNQSLAIINNAINQVQTVASVAPSMLEENIAALATIVARQIVAREVATSPDVITELVRRTLTEFPIDQALRIRVNPLDLTMLTAANAQDKQPITGARETSWFADPRIARGGCLVEGRDRIIDGRIDAALERAYHHMANIDAS
jgi:flagellar biosynthesis/type III secretory pathway protein FliH